ncbi:TadE/TadG family type IV pilus assembly protein [Sphingopyxis kveilinensis]|uniref:TadE/TadG family type IV pilus assembly protein n=1 Tax=Sphingopyxis kveilinensis TaxID=3114367 RepID=UPI0030D20A9F
MTGPVEFRRRMRRTMRRLAQSNRGSVMLEMAFSIPFLILVGFGGLEIANLTLAHTRVSQLGLNTADNAARIAAGSNLTQPQVREIDINEVFAGAERQVAGLGFENNGRIILSSLQRNNDGGQTIKWQRCFGNLEVASAYGVEGTGATGTGFPGMGPAGREVKAAAGTAIMFVEVTYEYQPLLFGAWLGPRTIRSTAAYNVREARDLSGVKAPGTPATCDD